MQSSLISGLIAVINTAGSWPLVMSTTKTRKDTPTCGVANPMPGAAYMVSIMSSIQLLQRVINALDRLRLAAQHAVRVGADG